MRIESLTYNIGKEYLGREHLEDIRKVVNGKGDNISDIRKSSRYDNINNFFYYLNNYEEGVEILSRNKDFFDQGNYSRIAFAKEKLRDLDVDETNRKRLEDLIENGLIDVVSSDSHDIQNIGGEDKEKFIVDMNKIVDDLYFRERTTYRKRNNSEEDDSVEIRQKIQGAIIEAKNYRNKKVTRMYDEQVDNSSCWGHMKKAKNIAYGRDKQFRTYKERFNYLRNNIDNTKLFTWNDLDELRAIKRYFSQNKYLDKLEKKLEKLKIRYERKKILEVKQEREMTINYLEKIIETREKILTPTKKIVAYEQEQKPFYENPQQINLPQSA